MQLTSLVCGVAGGALLTAAWMFNSGASGAGTPVSAAGGHAAVAGFGEDPEDLRAEIARLRELLDPERRRVRRTPVDPGAGRASEIVVDPDPAAANSAITGGPFGHVRDALLVELGALLNDPDIREPVLSNDLIASFLVEAWTDLGRPERAFELIRRHDLQDQIDTSIEIIAFCLDQSGRRDLAADAYLMGLARSPGDCDIIAELVKIAPQRALDAQTRILAERGWTDADGDFAAQRALLQMAAGHREAALQTIDGLIAAGDLPDNIWKRLLNEDPAAAEQRARTMLENATLTGVAEPAARMRLIAALRQQGRDADARTELDAVLRTSPDDYAAIQTLGKLDVAAALSHLRERTAVQQSPQLWGLYAQQLLAAGRRGEAIEAYVSAWRLAPQDGYHLSLLRLAPARIAPQLLRQATERQDDELAGNVADALWRAGRHAEARAGWQRAHDLDPDDSEWTDKLREVASGRDPLR